MAQSIRGVVASRIGTTLALALAVDSAASGLGYGSIFIKANNTVPLNVDSSWVGNAAPPTDGSAIIQWDNVASAPGAVIVGDSLQSYLGIKVLNPGGPVIIDNGSSESYSFLIGSSGIDLSVATQPFTINPDMMLSGAQTWNVGAGSSLTINGATSNVGFSLAIVGAGSTYINNVINGGGGLTKSGSGTLTFGSAQGAASNYASTITNGVLALDFNAPGAPSSDILRSTHTMTLGGAQLLLLGSGHSQALGSITFSAGANRISVADGSTLTLASVSKLTSSQPATVMVDPTGTVIWNANNQASIVDNGTNAYVTYGLNTWAATNGAGRVIPASYTNNATNSGNFLFTNLNVTGSFSAGTGFARSIRFNDSANVFTMTITAGDTFSGGGTLVSSVAAGGIIAGPGDLKPNRAASSLGATINFIQNSTNGDLTVSARIVNATGNTPVAIVKSGPGRLILANTANTNNGITYINEGIVSISSNGALGLQASIAGVQFNGGTLQTAANVGLYNGAPGTNNRNLLLNERGGTLDVASGTTLTVSGIINGAGALSKMSPGKLILMSSSSSYTGGTAVHAGTLVVNNGAGSATGTGSVTLDSGATLSGNGVISGDVLLGSGAHLAPGNSIGAINLNNLTLGSGSIVDLEFSGTPGDNDMINMLGNSSLTLAGSVGVNLFQSGGSSAFAINGTYALFTNVNNLMGAPVLFSVLNPIGNTSYVFSTNPSHNLVLTISGAPSINTWLAVGSGGWETSANWTPAIPGANGDIASFGSAFAGPGTASVSLNGNRTVGTLIFNNSAGSYDLVPGTGGTLTLSNGATSANINVLLGAHSISVPINLNGNANAATTNAGDILRLNGALGGTGALNAMGPGKVILNGNVSVNLSIAAGGTLQVGSGGTSGTLLVGSVANSGTLIFNRSDVATSGGTLQGSGSVVQAGTGTLVLTSGSNMSGSVAVNAGVLQFGGGSTNHVVGALSGNGIVQVLATVSLSSAGFNLGDLRIDGSQKVRANSSLANRTSTAGSLTLAGAPGAWTGSLDLTNNNLIVSNAAGGANVESQIRQAAHLGGWNVAGGITSSAAQAAATGSTATALGYATGAQYTAGNGATLFDNHTFNSTDTLVMYTLAGDGNMDRAVTFSDFLLLQNNYNGANKTWEQGDWNYDGSTTFADFLILQNNYNKTLSVTSLTPGGGAGAGIGGTTSVPEPGPLGILFLGGAYGLLRRRRTIRASVAVSLIPPDY